MARWESGSLEWIHRVREENYERTKGRDLADVMRESVEGGDALSGLDDARGRACPER